MDSRVKPLQISSFERQVLILLATPTVIRDDNFYELNHEDDQLYEDRQLYEPPPIVWPIAPPTGSQESKGGVSPVKSGVAPHPSPPKSSQLHQTPSFAN